MKSAATAIFNYALLRYLPYPDTGEFVNVGVVVTCADPVLFEFAVDPEHTLGRIRALFPEIDPQRFEEPHEAMRQELERVKALAGESRDSNFVLRLFKELVRPRESSFRFGEIRTTSSPHPASEAEYLFSRYVLRSGHLRAGGQESLRD